MCARQSCPELDQSVHVNTESTPVTYRVTLTMPELIAWNYRMQREPLEKSVNRLKENVEIKDYGCTQSQVKAAIHDQFAIEKSLESLYFHLDEKTPEIKKELQTIAKCAEQNKDCLYYLNCLTRVEDTFTRLSVKNIKRVLELQTRCLSDKFWSTVSE
ncbi:hypothetical protein PHET_10207 [Paragonimus heterotremus]|uniref:Uncharacterized protein n=1 Tax=Paragonimus heterotremus TaxID=100268 RepID=A0A8J4SK53_9TREM|nr:hypothetical protein PHET_10207 [Paragonimus heterotremus]